MKIHVLLMTIVMLLTQPVFSSTGPTDNEIKYVKSELKKLLLDSDYVLLESTLSFKRRKQVANTLYRLSPFGWFSGPIANHAYTVSFKLRKGLYAIPGKIQFRSLVAWSGESDRNNTTQVQVDESSNEDIYLSLRISHSPEDATVDVTVEDLIN